MSHTQSIDPPVCSPMPEPIDTPKEIPAVLAKFDALLSKIAVIVGAASLFVLTGLIVCDVTLRYFFNAPIFGAQDISVLALIMVVTVAIPYAGRAGMHVFVEALDKVLGKRANRIADIIVRLVGCTTVSILTYHLILGAIEVEEFEETTASLELSFAPFYQALAVGFAFYALIMLIEALILLRHQTVPTLKSQPAPQENSDD